MADEKDTAQRLEGTVDLGNAYLEWEAYDRPHYERGPLWYWSMGGVGLALLVYAVVAANFLFALIVLMSAIVIYLSIASEPKRIKVVITDTGVLAGDQLYPYRDINAFWLVYEPPYVQQLYLQVKSVSRPQVAISVEDLNPNLVRETLGNFVREELDKADEPLAHTIGRILKI